MPTAPATSKDGSRGRDSFSVANRLAALHLSGDYSDFTLTCESQEFKVHKAIVCPQSGFLRRLCDPKFKEGQAGKAVLKEVDPVLLQQAIQFLYTGQYAEPSTPNVADETLNRAHSAEIDAESATSSQSNSTVSDGGSPQSEYFGQAIVEIGLTSTGHSTFAVQEDHPGLLLNIRMYILADYLEIPLLKTEALEKCITILENEFEPASIIGPIEYALENTTGSDQQLRSTIFQLCSDQRDKVIACGKLDQLLSREEPIAWQLLKDQHIKHIKVAQKSDEESSRLAAEILNLELQLRDLRHELEGSEDTIRRKEDQLDDCVKLTQKWNGCRNCTVDFDVELERHRQTGEYFLRCKRCRCRHEEY